ncbi:hypothetical protein, partial [Enterobacter cloacae complex sp. 4DZ3-17B2]|uniref:hypothetical protein n=1 Tax=Enterobacter cloacae complex sp. 4DZ3-17B2 TaxID=2511990 RepID=UPI001CA5B7F6
MHNAQTQEANTENRRNQLKYLQIPYTKHIYESIENSFRNTNIKIVPSLRNNLSAIIQKGKDKLQKMDTHNTVYCIKCMDCDASYVGESKRTLKTRINEHQRNINRPSQTNTVITEHRIQTLHNFDWDN